MVLAFPWRRAWSVDPGHVAVPSPVRWACPWLVLRPENGSPQGRRARADLGMTDLFEEAMNAVPPVGGDEPPHVAQPAEFEDAGEHRVGMLLKVEAVEIDLPEERPQGSRQAWHRGSITDDRGRSPSATSAQVGCYLATTGCWRRRAGWPSSCRERGSRNRGCRRRSVGRRMPSPCLPGRRTRRSKDEGRVFCFFAVRAPRADGAQPPAKKRKTVPPACGRRTRRSKDEGRVFCFARLAVGPQPASATSVSVTC